MTISVEQSLECSPEEAWEALTNPVYMREWFFEQMPDFKAEVGFKTRFDVQGESQIFDHNWEVQEVVQGISITVSWKYPPHAGEGIVKFEIAPEGSGTLARVTSSGIESFPQDIPEFLPESCQAGWEYFFQGRLKAYINENEA